MRGNLLDLSQIWKASECPEDDYELAPAHLSLSWHNGLPYWNGLSIEDLVNIFQFSQAVKNLITLQETKLAWEDDFWQHFCTQNLAILQSCNLARLPAYTLVQLPSGLKVRRPRYDHSHSAQADPAMNHPPVKVRWPRGGRSGLADFVVEALLAENILAFRASQFDTEQAQMLAVATAPWFNAPGSYESGAIKHVAVALCKIDFWLFSR